MFWPNVIVSTTLIYLANSKSLLCCLSLSHIIVQIFPFHICIPSRIYILGHLYIIAALVGCLLYSFLFLVEIFHSLIVIVWRRSICLNDGDVEQECPRTDGNKPAENRATFDSVHHVHKTFKAMHMLVFFSAEVHILVIYCGELPKTLPSYFT